MKRFPLEQETMPEFNYHLLRNALSEFNKNLVQLDLDEYRQVYDRARKSFELESLVLSSDEAKGVIIPERMIDESVALVVSRYANYDEYLHDLTVNGLDERVLCSALNRELIFDAVLQRVALDCVEVSDTEVNLFYEMHRVRFEASERRIARHILITVNPAYPENIYAEALRRMEWIRSKLEGLAHRFHGLAVHYSECPTAVEGGKLGEVKRGQLYAALDEMLFSMMEGEISPIVESELGLHILLCEKIRHEKSLSPSQLEPGIRQLLRGRRKRNRQREWIAALRRPSD